MEHCDSVFSKKYGSHPINNIKSKLKLYTAVEKSKKILSANLESTIHVDCLLEDEDLTVNLKRDQFNEICNEVFLRFETFLTSFKKKLDDKSLKYSSLEVIGGSVRIPKLQEIISKVFGVEDLKKTLNFEECIAQGTSIVCAEVSPFYSVQSNKLFDSFPYKLVLKDLSRNKEFSLTEVGINYPFKKSIILLQDNDFTLQTEFVDGKFNIRESFIKKYDVELK